MLLILSFIRLAITLHFKEALLTFSVGLEAHHYFMLADSIFETNISYCCFLLAEQKVRGTIHHSQHPFTLSDFCCLTHKPLKNGASLLSSCSTPPAFLCHLNVSLVYKALWRWLIVLQANHTKDGSC